MSEPAMTHEPWLCALLVLIIVGARIEYLQSLPLWRDLNGRRHFPAVGLKALKRLTSPSPMAVGTAEKFPPICLPREPIDLVNVILGVLLNQYCQVLIGKTESPNHPLKTCIGDLRGLFGFFKAF